MPEYRDTFQSLIPLNLLLSAIAVFFYHRRWTWQFLASALFIILAGILVEWAGVSTGQLFGQYHYTGTLGYGIAGIPLLIGLNWLLLVYCCWQFVKWLFLAPGASIAHKARQYQGPTFRSTMPLLAIGAGALLMVMLDLFLEPFAMRTGMWQWEGGLIPVRNYIVWFVVSLLFLALLYQTEDAARINRVGAWMYVLQFAFFLSFLFDFS